MLELRFHGRGGQGTVVGTIVMAKAFFRAGYEVQSFPVFGVERRGAPVESYVRLDKTKIYLRTNITTPDHVVVQDTTLLQNIDVARGLKPGGWILINDVKNAKDEKRFANFRCAFIDANRIALDHKLGTRTHPIVNTAMLGALARVLEMPPLEAVLEAIREDIPIRTDSNISAAEEAYRTVCL
ncbi:MAG: 2-oxoacid:acceptor oxidoreductase family protein [Syntrophobacterales bacterium]|nr:2-oxoacid:acceptor oxidoreductase family protein [Syntrophobacterales bacterium]